MLHLRLGPLKKKTHLKKCQYYLGWFILFWQLACSANTVVHIIIIRERATKDGASILVSVKWVGRNELKRLVIQKVDEVHFRIFWTGLVILHTANSKGPGLLLMTDTVCMLAKWDGTEDVKFRDIINGANSKLTFFCDCKAVDKNK
jgi:hypothetical protein